MVSGAICFVQHINAMKSKQKLIWKIIYKQKMKVFAGLVATTLAAPAPAIIGGKNAVDGQFPHQVNKHFDRVFLSK